MPEAAAREDQSAAGAGGAVPPRPVRLLVRPRLLPGESLPSWLLRLSALNGRKVPDRLTPLIFGGERTHERFRGRLGHPSRVDIYDRLASLTLTEVGDLYAATWNVLATTLTPPADAIAALDLPGRPASPLLAPGTAVRLVYKTSAVQYCPACLREAAYHRLLWTAVPVASCARHNCALSFGCPACGAPTPMSAIVARRCAVCEADLADTPGVPLADDEHVQFSQAMLRRWLFGLPLAPSGGAGHILPAMSERALFRVVDGLRHLARATGTRWPYADDAARLPAISSARRPTPAEALRLYATAFRPLLDWPRSWRDFLDAYARQVGSPERSRGGDTRLGALYTTWIQREWRDPAFDPLQIEVDRYLLDRYKDSHGFFQIVRDRGGTLLERHGYLNAQQTAALLDIPPSLLDRLPATGRLTRYTAHDRRAGDSPTMFIRAEVLAIREEVGRWVRRPDAAAILGISMEFFDSLVDIGLVPVALPTAAGEHEWQRFDSAALVAWRDRLIADAVVLPPGQEPCPETDAERWLPSWHASKVVRPLGWTAAELLARVVAGTLRAFQPSSPPPTRLDALLFSHDELRAAIDANRANRDWLSSTAATALLGCGTRQFAALVRAGALTPVAVVGKTRYFTRASLDRHRSGCAAESDADTADIDIDTAARILGVGSSTVQLWAAAGHLPTLPRPARGHHKWRFDPAALSAWHAAHLTFAGATALLRLEAGEVQALVEQGRLTPVFGARRGRHFARVDVERLAEEIAAAPTSAQDRQEGAKHVATSKFGSSMRGLTAEEPMPALLDLLGHRWVLRILWELREGALGFGTLQSRCGGVSSNVLSERLTGLHEAGLVERDTEGGYALATAGRELARALIPLQRWAEHRSGREEPGRVAARSAAAP